MDEQLKQIGERLRGLRDVLDIEAQEVADLCGISLEHYLQMESGEGEVRAFRATAQFRERHRRGSREEASEHSFLHVRLLPFRTRAVQWRPGGGQRGREAVQHAAEHGGGHLR